MTSAPASQWEATPFFREFGVRIASTEPGFARLEVPMEAIQLRGVRESINGGVVAALAEAAMRVCVDTLLGAGERTGATRELSIGYLSAARGDTTHIEARMLRKGRRLAVGNIEVRDAGTGELNASARVACAVVPD